MQEKGKIEAVERRFVTSTLIKDEQITRNISQITTQRHLTSQNQKRTRLNQHTYRQSISNPTKQTKEPHYYQLTTAQIIM